MLEDKYHIRKKTVASMQRRCYCHDYNLKGHYMVTITVNARQPILGTLSGEETNAHVVLSQLGEVILNYEIPKIEKYYPMVRVWQVCIMPDHIHMILCVEEDLPHGKHLGLVIRGFKSGCTRAWWRMNPCVKAQGTQLHGSLQNSKVPAAFTAGKDSLFNPGYNDKILLRYGQLDKWKRYLNDNPRRLLIKRNNPQYFTVIHNIEVAGQKCQAIGNMFLLDVPQKAAVIIHHHYTLEDCARLREQWLAVGEAGGVLVGTAIAPMEKKILREAMERGYKIILLKDNGFPHLYKPSGESFDVCHRGQLLQLSPWEYHNVQKKITRQQCLVLNAMAEAIVAC